MAIDEVGIRVRLRERGKFSTDAQRVRDDVQGIGDAADDTRKDTDDLSGAMAALEKTMGLLKPAALLVGLGAIAQVAGAAGAGVVGLVSGLSPLVGALPAAGVGALAYGQAVGVAALATTGLMDAVGGLGETMDADALDKLTPQAQNFARVLNDLKPMVVDIQEAAQRGLFPGMETGLNAAMPLLRTFEPIVGSTAGALGQLAANAGRMFGGDAWVTGIGKLGATNVQIIGELGGASLHLATAIMTLLVAARPLALWLAKLVAGWAASANAATQNAQRTGKLNAFFLKTRHVLSMVFSILGAVGSAFMGLMRAAYPVGSELLGILNLNAEAMARWVNSAEGQSKLAAYFEQAKPVILEVGRLVRDVIGAFFELSAGTGALPMISSLRTDLLPVLVQVANTSTQHLGPALMQMVVQFADLLAVMSSSSGPLVIYAQTLGLIAQALVWILTNVPGLSQLISIALVGAAAWKIMKVAIAGAKAVHTGFLIAVGAGRTAIALYSIAMSTWRTVAIANGAAANIGALGIMRMVIAQRVATAATWMQTTAMGALNAIMALNPIILIVGLLVALGAAFVLAYNKIGWFRDGVNAVWSWIKENWPTILAILAGPIGLAVLYIVRHWDRIKDKASEVVGWVRDRFNGLVSFFSGIPGALGKFGSDIISFLEKPFKWLLDKAQWVIDKLEKVKKTAEDVGDFVTPGGDKGLASKNGLLGIGGIPLLASGGTVRGSGSWITGEAGPELNTKMPNGSVKVQPLSGSGGPSPFLPEAPEIGDDYRANFSVTVEHTTNLDGEPIARSVTKHAEDKKARR